MNWIRFDKQKPEVYQKVILFDGVDLERTTYIAHYRFGNWSPSLELVDDTVPLYWIPFPASDHEEVEIGRKRADTLQFEDFAKIFRP